MSDKTKAIFVILLASIISGATTTVSKFALLKIPPFSFSFLRFLVASIVILPFFLKSKVKIDRNFTSLLALSVLPIVNVAFYVLGQKTTTASIGQLLYSGTPILVSIFSYFILKKNVAIKKWFFVLLGLVGVSFAILLPLIEKKSLYSGDLGGNALISIGVIFWSIYNVLSKKYQQRYSPIVITATFIFCATAIFFFLSLPEFIQNHTWLNNLKPASILAVIYLAVGTTLLGYVLNQYAIKFGGPLLASLTFYLLPVFAYLSAFILLGERITTGLIIGTILVFISVALTTYSK
ncbi:DMT family transporter [Candidatus Roizmanbacteria bacterium]|nr:DMT family transporter [Candidatus Roizmanbacteria bacterium]